MQKIPKVIEDCLLEVMNHRRAKFGFVKLTDLSTAQPEILSATMEEIMIISNHYQEATKKAEEWHNVCEKPNNAQIIVMRRPSGEVLVPPDYALSFGNHEIHLTNVSHWKYVN